MDSYQGQDTTHQPKGDRVAPPAYDNRHASLGNSGLPIPPPATDGKFYFKSKMKENIELCLCPRPPLRPNGQAGPGRQTWFARLNFKCDNVPQLMREGLHWSLDNVQWEDGYFDDEDEDDEIHDDVINDYIWEHGLTRTRHYFLRDLQVPRRWIAHLQVHAKHLRILSNLRLENLSPDNIFTANAWSNNGSKVIYVYASHTLENSYNAIYDDMPMGGWWPWPKKEERQD
ncbi:hypothetical protein F4806DRAFT_496394 [Annulohypoxylon nitens]|nr:hypothetical protein F4806DRAFT_496394 [Annulohypoxylon nitens]